MYLLAKNHKKLLMSLLQQPLQTLECLVKKYPRFCIITLNHLYKVAALTLEIQGMKTIEFLLKKCSCLHITSMCISECKLIRIKRLIGNYRMAV